VYQDLGLYSDALRSSPPNAFRTTWPPIFEIEKILVISFTLQQKLYKLLFRPK